MKWLAVSSLLVFAIIGIFTVPNAFASVQVDPASIYYNDNGNYIPYKLTDTVNSTKVQTKDGSYIFDKNSCSLSFWDGTTTTGTPTLGSDTYSVLASQGNTGVWNPVSIINNAVCNTVVSENNGAITITGTKSVTGAGVFQINYTKPKLQPLKITFSATNNNPAWTNYHIGMSETLQVPQYIKLGNLTYNLAQFNGTVLNRNWINSNSAQLMQLSSTTQYDMGIGWNHASQVTILWINGKAYLKIDYTYNTPILSPGQTITVDPILADNHGSSSYSAGVTSLTLSGYTIGSGTNRMLVVGLNDLNPAPVADPVSISYGTQNLTKLTSSSPGGNWGKLWIYYLVAPTSGSNTLNVRWAGASNYGISAVSYTGVKQSSSAFGTPNGTSATGTTPYIGTVTTNAANSIVFSIFGDDPGGFGTISATSPMVLRTQSSGAIATGDQNATTTGKYTSSWSVAGGAGHSFAQILVEIKGPAIPSTPTLTHANTLNTTAIKLDWPSVSGATFYIVKQASPYTGVYTQIANQSGTTLTVTGLTAGSQFGFKVAAGNTTGTSSDSALKSNYTTNVAPTSPLATSISGSQERITVTNPSGNFSGYKIFGATPPTNPFALLATSSNTTNHYDLSGLTPNSPYGVKLATRYAVGTNSSGVSSNSTTVLFYTVPNAPSLALSQSVVNVLHLSWSLSGANTTVSGYKIERSIDFGASWITLVANTLNSATTYDDSGLTTGNSYTYRVSAIAAGGTSLPSSPVTATVLSAIQLNPTSGYGNYNTTALNFGLSLDTSTFQVFPLGNASYNHVTGKQEMSWYTGSNGSPTLTKKLGSGISSLTLSCNLDTTFGTQLTSKNQYIYYECADKRVQKINIFTGVNTHLFTASDGTGLADGRFLFLTQSHVFSLQTHADAITAAVLSWESGNTTLGISPRAIDTISNNEKLSANSQGIVYNYNTTSWGASSGIANTCSINYSPTNTTTAIDNIACSQSVEAEAIRYWNGLMIQKVGNYNTNNTQYFINSIDVNPYKKVLSLPCDLLGVGNVPCTTFVLTDTTTNTDYLMIITSTGVYYKNMNTAYTLLTNNNYALQSYSIVPYTETSSFNIVSPQSLKLYGPVLNVTISKNGLLTIPSGYYIKGSTVESAIRAIDPRWTNDNTDIPALTTTTSTLFPIYLTVSNAPVNGGLMVTYPSATINSIAGVWTVTLLDATHSAEFDIPPTLCGLVYVADVSVQPSIWNYEGQICATGANQKTIAYTNTLPLNFWTLPYGVTDSFTPSTNGLTTTFHTTAPSTTYTVTITNSTGATAQTYTFTMASNATIDTQSYNLTGVSKPAGLYVYVGSQLIYSAFLGSSVSLASIASFFQQYFTYQGFSLLAFIPIVFASMFTRNTVGIGVVLTVLCIATLSWLSIVVIPELDIYIMIVIAIIGLIAYRIYYG